MKVLIRAAIDERLIEDQPVNPLAHIIFGALQRSCHADRARQRQGGGTPLG
jgi:hypothetical protein